MPRVRRGGQDRASVEEPRFFSQLTGSGVSEDLYLDAFDFLATHLPGLGGRATFDTLTPGRVTALADRIVRRKEAEHSAARRAARKGRS